MQDNREMMEVQLNFHNSRYYMGGIKRTKIVPDKNYRAKDNWKMLYYQKINSVLFEGSAIPLDINYLRNIFSNFSQIAFCRPGMESFTFLQVSNFVKTPISTHIAA